MLGQPSIAFLNMYLNKWTACSVLCFQEPVALCFHVAGGGTVPQAVRAIFADPWSEDVLACFMYALNRRLLSAPFAASYLLNCAAAVASACPSRVRQEQLHAMWDVCLR